MACDCWERKNAQLEEQGFALPQKAVWDKNKLGFVNQKDLWFLEVEKSYPRTHKRKPVLIAIHCPMCGILL